MPAKTDPYRSYGQKLISLFARLLFSGESHSLVELSRMLDCSKQTVLRLIEDIKRSYGIVIEESLLGRRKYFRIRKESGSMPPLAMTSEELVILQMCHAFTEHLLGRKLFQEAAIAIGKSRAGLKDACDGLPERPFSALMTGTLDYSGHKDTILTLCQAMDKKLICKMVYRNLMARQAKTFYIKPYRLFSYRDTIYLHAGIARKPGQAYHEPDFDPVLALQRINAVEITQRAFVIPDNYDFERDFNQTFGIMKDHAFSVQVEFSGWAANYAAERTWSPDQKIVKRRDGAIKITFTASSEEEVLSQIMSFGEHAVLLKPVRLRKRIKETIRAMSGAYE